MARTRIGLARGHMVRIALVALVAVALSACGSSGSAVRPGGSARPGASGVSVRWFGTNAWAISFDSKTILIDPWLTRFPTGTYATARPRSVEPPQLTVDPTKIDPYVDGADLILVTHGHFDHMADVPYLAAKTGAPVLGTVSHVNMLRALDVPARQLTTVSGGRHLTYDGYTVDVFTSLHSLGPDGKVPFPGTRLDGPPPRPRTVADLVEGGSLAYQITIANRFRIFVLGSANFDEKALAGLHPDLAIVAAGGGDQRDFAQRLMRVLDHPARVVPAHWDDFDYPLDQPARDWGGVNPLRDAIAAASPGTEFVKLDHLQSFKP